MKKLYCCEITSHNPFVEVNEREITESVFIVDGYHIADRLLEGVEFHVHFEDDKVLSVKVAEKHAAYFSQFNEKMFLEAAEKSALRTIEGDEVDVPDYIKKKYNFTSETAAYIK